MRLDLGWSYAQAGAMNTANAVGYLIGALAAAPLAARVRRQARLPARVCCWPRRRCSRPGWSSDYAVLAVLRAVAGAAGALSLITGGALAAAAGGGGGKGRPALALGRVFRRRRIRHGGLGLCGAGIGGGGRLAHRMVRSRRARRGRDGQRRCRRWRAHRMSRARRRVVHRHSLHRDARNARGAGELCPVRRRLHRLHDVHRCLSAQPTGLRRGRCDAVLGLRRPRSDRRPDWRGDRCWRGCPVDAASARRMPW